MITGSKKLLATTDYYDNIIGCHTFFSREHLDALHSYLADLGVSRHQWMFNPVFTFYEENFSKFDLLAEATDSAHRHGLELYAVIKPFEGGGSGEAFPHSLPVPQGIATVKDLRGLFPITRPFVAQNLQLCLKRRPGAFSAAGPIATIRLVKGDDGPTRIRPEHLSIWTSRENNHFQRYQGPVSFRESIEWRPCFPKTKFCRMLHLEGLQWPVDHRYLVIRCALADDRGDFINERGQIVELIDKHGDALPFIFGSGPVACTGHCDKYETYRWKEIFRYFQLPEIQAIFSNRSEAERYYRDFYNFDVQKKITELYALDKTGYLALACGKPEYLLGNLHPIYPEVRRHWLDMIQYCLDRRVDGINIRTSNHSRSPEAWEYGFNEPVLQVAGGRTDYPTIRRINGDAYTLFLREARDLAKSYGKSITIHLYSQMLMPDDRSSQLSYIPPNFEWQWEKWIQEIADDLEFRGAWTLRPWNLRQVLETFASVTRQYGKPFYYQGNMKELGFKGPYHFTASELEMISQHPGVDGFVLFETANFTKLIEHSIEAGPDLGAMLIKYFPH